MSNLTRRAILRSSAVTAAAAAAFGVPAVTLAKATVAPASTDPLVALAGRSAALRSDARMAYTRYLLAAQHKKDPAFLAQFAASLTSWSEEHRAALVETVAAYDENSEDEEAEVRSCELDRIEDGMAATPARNLDGLLAKLRWIANYSDDGLPDLPTLETAYSWSGEGRRDTMAISAWADAERLVAGAA